MGRRIGRGRGKEYMNISVSLLTLSLFLCFPLCLSVSLSVSSFLLSPLCQVMLYCAINLVHYALLVLIVIFEIPQNTLTQN